MVLSNPAVSLGTLNTLPEDEARKAFMQCCSSTQWIDKMVASRPYRSIDECQNVARSHWADLSENDYLEAFEGHPKIGNVDSLRAKYASTKALASGEQSSVNDADEDVIQGLATGNQQYEEQNGFIFIVCATGKSAKEMLDLLEARLDNTRTQELEIAAGEQAKITAIRINKLLVDKGPA